MTAVARTTYTKDPADVLDYQIDWSTWLAGDTITASTWTVPDGLTKESDSSNTTSATVWLSGGTNGTYYQATNSITTSAGRTVDLTIGFIVRDQ